MPTLRDLRIWLLIAATYFAAAKLGLTLAFLNASTTAVWPPTGIALAAMLLRGPRVWPGIFLGAFLANATTAGSPLSSVIIATGNTLEAVAGAYLVTRFAGGRQALSNGRSIFRFVLLAGIVSTEISATVGVATLTGFGLLPAHAAPTVWFTWWLGDGTGAVTIAPVILTWGTKREGRWTRRDVAELLLIFTLLLSLGWITFVASNYPLTFTCIPLCVWAAYRFGQREAAIGSLALSAVAVFGTVQGLGVFGHHAPNDALLLLQGYIATTSVVGVAVGAAVQGWREAETALRRSHAGRLNTIIDAEPAWLQLVSASGEILDINRAGLHTVGANDPSQVLGRSAIELVHEADRAAYLSLHRAALDGTAGHAEFRVTGVRGEERWVDCRAVPFSASVDTPDIPAVLTVTTDMTERRLLEEQLRQSQRLDAVGQLAGGIAHDFNNLLTAMLGFCDLSMSHVDEASPARPDLQEIKHAGQRAVALTQQLLAFSRKQVMKPQVLDLNATVERMFNLLPRLIGEDVHVTTELDPALLHVRADPTQVEQVLMNLAVNARDAMPTGGELRFRSRNVTLTEPPVSHAHVFEPGRYVVLEVIDNGRGMDEPTRVRVFEPFFTTKELGTGLGLATVYGIVKQSRGFITVDSRPGGGSTFTIYLPGTDAAVEPKPDPASETPAGGTERILLVEDEASVRRLVKRTLEARGYTVVEASNGFEALSIAGDAADVDLLLTDMIMPGMTGLQVAEELRRRKPGLRVLYMSGYSKQTLEARAPGEPRLHLLQKPFGAARLAQYVRDALAA